MFCSSSRFILTIFEIDSYLLNIICGLSLKRNIQNKSYELEPQPDYLLEYYILFPQSPETYQHFSYLFNYQMHELDHYKLLKSMKLFLFILLFMCISYSASSGQIQNQVHIWINKARRNPRILIPHIQRQLNKFHGRNIQLRPGFNHATREGRSAWVEAINFLRRQRPMTGLRRHRGLDLSARSHCSYLARVRRVTHTGAGGSRLRDRVQRYSIYDNGLIGQNIAQQFTVKGRNYGLETVVTLIIDDGVYNRGHRKSLFNPKFNYIGISTQRSAAHYYTVINLSSHNLRLRGGKSRKTSRSRAKPRSLKSSRSRRPTTKRTVTKVTKRRGKRAGRPVQARRHPHPPRYPNFYGWGYPPHPFFY